jgi:hypothetical protein
MPMGKNRGFLHFSVLAIFLRNNLTEKNFLCPVLVPPIEMNSDNDEPTEIQAMFGKTKENILRPK